MKKCENKDRTIYTEQLRYSTQRLHSPALAVILINISLQVGVGLHLHLGTDIYSS